MKSGIFDKNGIEVKEGDTLIFPYVTPIGELTNDEDFRAKIVFKHGCFGYETEINFVPLFEWQLREKGDYVSNCGNKIIYTGKYTFWILKQD